MQYDRLQTTARRRVINPFALSEFAELHSRLRWKAFDVGGELCQNSMQRGREAILHKEGFLRTRTLPPPPPGAMGGEGR